MKEFTTQKSVEDVAEEKTKVIYQKVKADQKSLEIYFFIKLIFSETGGRKSCINNIDKTIFPLYAKKLRLPFDS